MTPKTNGLMHVFQSKIFPFLAVQFNLCYSTLPFTCPSSIFRLNNLLKLFSTYILRIKFNQVFHFFVESFAFKIFVSNIFIKINATNGFAPQRKLLRKEMCHIHREKHAKIRVFFDLYFPVWGQKLRSSILSL